MNQDKNTIDMVRRTAESKHGKVRQVGEGWSKREG